MNFSPSPLQNEQSYGGAGAGADMSMNYGGNNSRSENRPRQYEDSQYNINNESETNLYKPIDRQQPE